MEGEKQDSSPPVRCPGSASICPAVAWAGVAWAPPTPTARPSTASAALVFPAGCIVVWRARRSLWSSDSADGKRDLFRDYRIVVRFFPKLHLFSRDASIVWGKEPESEGGRARRSLAAGLAANRFRRLRPCPARIRILSSKPTSTPPGAPFFFCARSLSSTRPAGAPHGAAFTSLRSPCATTS